MSTRCYALPVNRKRWEVPSGSTTVFDWDYDDMGGRLPTLCLFSRVVPTVKDIGLWGPKIQRAHADMGVIQFQDLDPESLSAEETEE